MAGGGPDGTTARRRMRDEAARGARGAAEAAGIGDGAGAGAAAGGAGTAATAEAGSGAADASPGEMNARVISVVVSP
jgi:hypothetical protein